MVAVLVRRAVALCALLLFAASPAAARDVWREVFQSSPASYDPLPPGMIAAAAKQFKLPVAVIEAGALPRTATGTFRFRFAVSAGGKAVRIRVSNETGRIPLRIEAASLGIVGKGYDATPGSLRPLTFDGRTSVTVPAGALLLSDPVAIATMPGTELLASLFTPDTLTIEPRGGAMVAVAAADQTLAATMAAARPLGARPFVSAAEVLSSDAPNVIVTLGDSITDGNRADLTVLRGWPAELAQRLAARRGGPRIAVANAGIGGNRLLDRGNGDAALARFDRDVLRIAGVTHVVILEGTNDIGMSGRSIFGDNPPVSAEDIVGAYTQLIARAHARGIKVVLATMLPFGKSASHYSPEKELVRQAVNRWIRTAKAADAVIDFDAVGRDPANPVDMRQDFGSIDGLHPGAIGYKAMGDAIDLAIFK